jgi:rare lipoprotein A
MIALPTIKEPPVSRISALVAAAVLTISSLAHAQKAPAAPATAAAPAAANASPSDALEGKVAHYGRKFTGRRTASGEKFNPGAMTMAHKTLPFGTKVRVTNMKNKRSVVVRVNDRGPTTPDRVGDLSSAAARKIGMLRSGVVEAKLEVVAQAKGRTGERASKRT